MSRNTIWYSPDAAQAAQEEYYKNDVESIRQEALQNTKVVRVRTTPMANSLMAIAYLEAL